MKTNSPNIKRFESKRAPENLEDRDWIGQDKLLFSNGGSVADSEERAHSLVIRTPGGANYEADGYIGRGFDTQEPVIKFSTKGEAGRRTDWQQSFPIEGGTVLRKESDGPIEDILITVGPDGSVSGKYEDEGPPVEAERQGNTLVLPEWGDQTVSPPVPLDWFLA